VETPAVQEPKEPRMRTAFNTFAAIVGVFGLGMEMQGNLPFVGLFLITSALAYL
jgi:hypothetical protein